MWVLPTNNRNRRDRQRSYGNPARRRPGCGPLRPKMGPEVCTFMELPSFPVEDAKIELRIFEIMEEILQL
jgi:hypothetical protein